jgi:sulfatase maturation enzyme AslB (radical SAM superfamily)
MRNDNYANQIEKNQRFRDLYKRDFKRRLEFCRDNGCNTVVLTGDGEPMMNTRFLEQFSEWNESIRNPFQWIELQTSGVTIDDEKLRFLRNTVNISTISVSLSNVFSSEGNQIYNGTPEAMKVDIDKLCSEIKRYDFNLRLSLNLTDVYNAFTVESVFLRLLQLKANQVTFRVLYPGEDDTPETKWIAEHAASKRFIEDCEQFVKTNGRELEILSFGAIRYSVRGISVVMDNDCMSRQVKNTLRYMVLRPNCKLYSKWDDEGSLIF